MIPNIVQTADGSITCIDPISGELYHNREGAYTEALTHYVRICDLSKYLKEKSSISVLDGCFGIGYNSFVLIDALLQHAQSQSFKLPLSCHIVAIDQDSKILDLIPQVLLDSRFAGLCKAFNINIARAKEIVEQWRTVGQYNFNFKNDLSISIEMKIADLRQVVPQLVKEQMHFDYIFHDGFSPRSMPELWTVDLFAEYTKLLAKTGRIITYSSAYAVRGAFKSCGLEVRKSGPLGGKSGGTIAFKKDQPEIANNQNIFFLSDEENERLNNNSGIPYRDPDFNSTAKQIIDRRELEIRQKASQ